MSNTHRWWFMGFFADMKFKPSVFGGERLAVVVELPDGTLARFNKKPEEVSK